MKKIIQALLILAILTSLAGCSSGNTSNATSDQESAKSTISETKDKSEEKLTNIQNDGYIIYDLSYNDALLLSGKSGATIQIKEDGSKKIYTYVDHVLSCGTYMNGEIVEDLKDNIKTIKGSFDVTKNPYSITELKVDISIDTKTDKKTGYLNINGEKIDINSNFNPIK